MQALPPSASFPCEGLRRSQCPCQVPRLPYDMHRHGFVRHPALCLHATKPRCGAGASPWQSGQVRSPHLQVMPFCDASSCSVNINATAAL